MPEGPPPGPRDVVDAGLAVFVASLLGLEALRAFLAGVYALNVLTTGLNASVVAVLLLLAPLASLLGLARLSAGHSAGLFALAFLGLRLAMFVAWPVPVSVLLAGLAVAAYLLFLVPFLAGVLRLAGGAGASAAGVSLAFGADLALRTLFHSLDPGATLWSLAYVVPLGALLAYIVLRIPLPRTPDPPSRIPRVAWAVGVGLGGFWSVTVIVLEYPLFMARWTAQPATPFVVAVLLGFCGGGYLARVGLGSAARSARWSRVLLLLGLAFFLLAFPASEPLPFLALLASAAAAIGLERLLSAASVAGVSVRSMGLTFAVGSCVFLLALLTFVFTLTSGFVPPSSAWRGNAAAVLVLASAAFFAPALVLAGRAPAAVPSPASRRWTAVAAACILLLGSGGLALAPSAAPVDPASDVLRVMTFNVHQGFDADGRLDVDRIVDMVRFANPDVLALQESDTVRITSGGVDLVGVLASRLGYHAAYGPPTREQTYGVAILSRLPIAAWTYVLLASTGDQRVLVQATLRTVRGDLHVFAVHLGLDPAERDIQVQQVLAFAAGLPTPRALLGDFNACPSGVCARSDDPSDSVYEAVVGSYRDAWVAAGGGIDDSAGYTYHSQDPYERIDYVFASPDLQVLDAAVLRDPVLGRASDHAPVVASLRLPSLP